MDQEILFDNYFSDSLTQEQEKLLNQLLKTDAEFKERFEFERDLQRASELREHRNVRKMLVGFEDTLSESKKEMPTIGSFRNWSIAASIALLMGLSWLGYNSFVGIDYNGLFNKNYVEYPSTVNSILRGANNANTLEQKAFEAYDTDHSSQAIQLFNELKSTKNADYADFYLGQTYLKTGDIEKAKTLFNTVITSKNELAPEARWYLALTYLKVGEKENAVQTLKGVIADARYNREEAQTLLNELE